MGRRLSATDLKVATGEWWYAMNDEEGKPMGYCHYTTNTVADGSVRVEWQLRLAFPGGTYEEDRSMDLDGSLRMKAASYAAGGATCAGARDGKRITVTRKAPQGAEGTTGPRCLSHRPVASGLDTPRAARYNPIGGAWCPDLCPLLSEGTP